MDTVQAIIVTGDVKEIADLIQTVQGRQASAEDTAKDVIRVMNDLIRRAEKPVLLF